MSDVPEDDKPISVRFKHAEEKARFLARAKELGLTKSELARQFIVMGLDGKLPGSEPPATEVPPSPSVSEIRQTVIKAAFATIVALSPELDERQAEEFLRSVFGDFGPLA